MCAGEQRVAHRHTGRIGDIGGQGLGEGRAAGILDINVKVERVVGMPFRVVRHKQDFVRAQAPAGGVHGERLKGCRIRYRVVIGHVVRPNAIDVLGAIRM